MYYIAIMWLIALSTILFAEYFHANSSVGKTQMYADLLSDGSAFAGNNGWGLDEKEANKTYKKLISLNKKNFKDCKPQRIVYTNTDSKGKIAPYDNTLSGEKNKNNTTNVTVKLKTKTLTTKNSLNRTKKASTRITYSGGLKIVLEAYKHTYEYNPASQTAYLWGGGHGIAADSAAWEQSSDCSGFVSGVFRKCGYDVTSEACTWDMEGMGKLVDSLDKARPGDIILFWYGGGTSQHVAIYAGKKNGIPYIIHARGGSDCVIPVRNERRGVHITPLSAVGYSKIMIRRIVDTSSDAYEIQLRQLMAYGLSRYEAVIFEGLRSAGFKDTAIAAIMGNWSGESSSCNGEIDPDCIEYHEGNKTYLTAYHNKIVNGEESKIGFVYDGKGQTQHSGGFGYGIIQWTTVDWANPMADRKAKLWDYAYNRGSNVTDIYTQVSFAINEMETTHAKVSPTSSFNNMTDITAATRFFCENFEGIPADASTTHIGTRVSNANRYFRIASQIPR